MSEKQIVIIYNPIESRPRMENRKWKAGRQQLKWWLDVALLGLVFCPFLLNILSMSLLGSPLKLTKMSRKHPLN